METLPKNLIETAEKLSAEWDAVCFIVENRDKSLEAIVWNNYKYEIGTENKRPVVASVERTGWRIYPDFKNQYEKR